MSLLTRKQRKVEQKTTVKKLTAQRTMKVRRIMSLENCQLATSGEQDCYSIDESDKICFVFQSDSEEEDFYGFD